MKKEFIIYNPGANVEVTTFYVDVIGKSLEKSGFAVRYTTDIKKEQNKNAGILVTGITDVKSARRMGYKTIILWMQGSLPEESFMRHGSYIRKWILDLMEGYAVKKSSFIFFVSDEMKSHVEKKHKIVLKNTYIMPCFNCYLNKQAFGLAAKYKENSFVYVGGLQKWQCFAETVQIYAEIEKRLRDTKLYVYTKETETAEKLLEKFGIKNRQVKYVTQEHLSEELQDKKFGFVIRKDTVVNQVSTPTKLSNYISCGIIPIFTEAIRDFTNVMEHNKYCMIIRNELGIEKAAEEVCSSDLLGDIDNDAIYKEYKKIFESYYSEQLHINMASEKLKKFLRMELAL